MTGLSFDAILAAAGGPTPGGEAIGRSREGRPLFAHRFAPERREPGAAPLAVSLIGGCHADEPVGPRLLVCLVGALAALSETHPARADVDWWIVPEANPDGAARNAAWASSLHPAGGVDLLSYLAHVVREAPGDDVEFGFPRDANDGAARPENRAIAAWWRTSGAPFHLHASLHGMSLGEGPWFLVEGTWWRRTALRPRLEVFMARCRHAVRALGYRLHDVDRGGEKGFTRIGPGFTTCPDSRAMRAHFEALGETEIAARFRPSSMEAIRALGGDPLTLVSEMPLFLVPQDAGGALHDPFAWRERFGGWRARLAATSSIAGESGAAESGAAESGAAESGAAESGAAESGAAESGAAESGAAEALAHEIEIAGVRPMPIADQMRLQWTMIEAGLEATASVR